MSILKPNKTLQIPGKGLTYAYIHIPSKSNKPTLLFIHGFPATSHEWKPQVDFFSSLGYGIIAPDCLGYGGTSKPLDVNLYIGKAMASDIIAILDHEKIATVIGIAHDWGTYLLSSLATWYESRLDKFVFMSIGHSTPGRALDVHAINRTTKKHLGYEIFGYQVFFASEGAGKIIGDHWESFFHLVFPAEPEFWAGTFAPLNALSPFIQTDKVVPLAPWISAESKAHHHAMFGNDYSAPCTWYQRGIENLGLDAELKALKQGTIHAKLRKETLMLTGTKDKVCLSDKARQGMNGVVEGGERGPLLRVVDVDAGHWIMLERSEETNALLLEFFESGAKGKSGKSVL